MFTLTVTPRFYETDALGHVNNTVLPQWFEAARDSVFRLFSADMDLEDWPLILARIDVDFTAQIYYGKDVTIETTIAKIGNSSFVVHHDAYQEGILVAKGNAVQVCFDHKIQKSVPIRDDIRAMLQKHYVEPKEA